MAAFATVDRPNESAAALHGEGRALPPGARYRAAAYRFWHDHLTSLLDTAPDPHTTTHTLLAALSAEQVGALLPELGAHRLRMGLMDLAVGCAAPDAPPGAVLPRR
ncbi:hypothetical protein ABZ461_24035 [Actinacidiphila glaucinigra]|uniref:hypothetical protein n=1 Tax=Actinacidiphila glaucinigra TaxID=235986 RepID=UPI0033E82631